MNKSKKLVSEPGHKYIYSNPGYLLLGKIIECVSGISFGEFTRKHIFEPLQAGEDQIGFDMNCPENPVLMNKKTRRKMFLPQTGPEGEILPTTLGWDHGKLAGIDYITRPGGGLGFHSNIRIYAGKIATIMLINKTLLHAKLINMFSDEIDRDFVLTGVAEAP